MTCVWSAALVGVAGVPVEVEVRISSQLPRVDIVGLPEAAVRESVSRIRGAISATGLSFPNRRVTINLAPAELRKGGAGLDLPIAIGILGATGVVPPDSLAGRGLLGELALDGRLRPTRGTLAAVLAMRDVGAREAIVPRQSAQRACYAPDIRILGAQSLGAVVRHLRGEESLPQAVADPIDETTSIDTELCISDIRGQPLAKRAIEIAAAGGHGLLMTGPPGTGKTLLARRLPGLLPPLREEERLEAFRVLDASGAIPPDQAISNTPPFRAPHHTASAAGLLGGGNPVRPGEVSLAHHGVLFLDELPEFDRRCLESLREVIEQGVVRIARANYACELPARFQLIAAANPCPCGLYGTPGRDCRCDDATLARYRRKLSGPLLDRVDLGVHGRRGSLGGAAGTGRGPHERNPAPTRRAGTNPSIRAGGKHQRGNSRRPPGRVRARRRAGAGITGARGRAAASVGARCTPAAARGAHDLRPGGPRRDPSRGDR